MYLHDSFQLWRRLVRHDALGVHFDLGLRAFDARDRKRLIQNRIAVAILPEGGPHTLEYLALLWREHWIDGRHYEALDVARQIIERFPGDADGPLELAQMLIDLERPEEATAVLLEGVKQSPQDSDLWFELGLAAERANNEELRVRAFHEVWRLEHEDEPEEHLFLSEENFLKLVETILDTLPSHVREALGNVAIIVEDYPEEWLVSEGTADPRILGLFVGPPLHAEGSVESVSEGPSRIYLYRWNIERQCSSLEDVEREVHLTILHEIGHYLGLDEDELHKRGLS